MKRGRLFAGIALMLFGVAVLYGGLLRVGLAPLPNTNISETKLVVNNLNGAGFEVIYTNSDSLAKEEWVNVYVYEAGRRSDWLGRLIHPRTLLFSYDPWNSDDVPRIEGTGPGSIRISIPRVSSVIYQSHRWKDLSVDYQIGFIEDR